MSLRGVIYLIGGRFFLRLFLRRQPLDQGFRLPDGQPAVNNSVGGPDLQGRGEGDQRPGVARGQRNFFCTEGSRSSSRRALVTALRDFPTRCAASS